MCVQIILSSTFTLVKDCSRVNDPNGAIQVVKIRPQLQHVVQNMKCLKTNSTKHCNYGSFNAVII